jgi:uncharacterized tellurite resistance protein B-like protein
LIAVTSMAVQEPMLDRLSNLISEFVDGAKPAERFAGDDERLAAAALLIHVVMIDGQESQSEYDALRRVLQDQFDLDEVETGDLIAAAKAADSEAIDLYRFTSLINRRLDEAGRLRLVEMMWEIVYADGRMNEFEDNIVWRAADLLGISANDRITLRRRVAGQT